MKQVSLKYHAWLAVCILLFMLFIPPHHHHGGTACFASDFHERNEAACPDPEHHCDEIPDAGDPCMANLQSALIQSFKANAGTGQQLGNGSAALLPDFCFVPSYAVSISLIISSVRTYLPFAPGQILARRGPPVWG